LLEAADLDEEGGEAMKTTTIREEMTTLTTSDSVHPAHTTINFSDKEKGGLSDEETGGGVATVDANLRGRVGDAANEEKIQTTATEKERARVRARAMRQTAVAGGGMGSKTMMTEAVAEAPAVTSRVDTGAATTVMTATMVTVTAMTRLNVCDASTEEKERPSNPSRMHATIK
jgi:hypothetical protein